MLEVLKFKKISQFDLTCSSVVPFTLLNSHLPQLIYIVAYIYFPIFFLFRVTFIASYTKQVSEKRGICSLARMSFTEGAGHVGPTDPYCTDLSVPLARTLRLLKRISSKHYILIIVTALNALYVPITSSSCNILCHLTLRQVLLRM